MAQIETASGIRSLAGFAFQMRVLILKMAQLGPGMEIQFETLDDVTTRTPVKSPSGDVSFEGFNARLVGSGKYDAIQAKRTSLSFEDKQRLLLSWILLDIEKPGEIGRFLLVSDRNVDISFTDSELKPEYLYQLVVASEQKATALLTRVKSAVAGSIERFTESYERVKSQSGVDIHEEIDRDIFKSYEQVFRHAAVQEQTYEQRVHEFVVKISSNILEEVNRILPYTCTFAEMYTIVESVCSNVTDEKLDLDFSAFRRVQEPLLDDALIRKSREAIQLQACGLSSMRIEEHLIFNQYYLSLRRHYLSNRKAELVRNLEETTNSNFKDVLDGLVADGRDTPLQRLINTKLRPNSNSSNDQNRWGSCVYLTSDEANTDLLISWRDDE